MNELSAFAMAGAGGVSAIPTAAADTLPASPVHNEGKTG